MASLGGGHYDTRFGVLPQGWGLASRSGQGSPLLPGDRAALNRELLAWEAHQGLLPHDCDRDGMAAAIVARAYAAAASLSQGSTFSSENIWRSMTSKAVRVARHPPFRYAHTRALTPASS